MSTCCWRRSSLAHLFDATLSARTEHARRECGARGADERGAMCRHECDSRAQLRGESLGRLLDGDDDGVVCMHGAEGEGKDEWAVARTSGRAGCA